MFDSLLFGFSFFFCSVCLLFLLSFAFHSLQCIAALLPCIRQIKARISWESSCSSKVASLKRTTSFVVWRKSIYWTRLKAKQQSRWVTTISETISRLVRSNKVLCPGCLKLTLDLILLVSS